MIDWMEEDWTRKIDLYRRTRFMPKDMRVRYEREVDIAIDECLQQAHFLLGRVAPVLIPAQAPLIKLALKKGSPHFVGFFQGCSPNHDHLRDKAWDCFEDMKRRFVTRFEHQFSSGPLLNLTEGIKFEIVRDKRGHLLGWGERIARNNSKGEPAKLIVRRGLMKLGTVNEIQGKVIRGDGVLPRYFRGELRQPVTGDVIHAWADGAIEVFTLDGICHIAALDQDELGHRTATATNTIRAMRYKLRAMEAVLEVVDAYASELHDDEPKTLAEVCRKTGDDWQQMTWEIIESAFRRSAAQDDDASDDRHAESA